MIVLVLQSFLAVSFQVCCVKQSKLQASPQHFSVQVSQVFCKCDRHFEPLVQLPSQVTSCVLCATLLNVTPLPSYSFKLQVYELLALSMAEAVMVRSLDLMDSYYTLSVSSSH